MQFMRFWFQLQSCKEWLSGDGDEGNYLAESCRLAPFQYHAIYVFLV